MIISNWNILIMFYGILDNTL